MPGRSRPPPSLRPGVDLMVRRWLVSRALIYSAMMTPTTASSLRAAATVLSSLIIIFPAIWGGFALWYQTSGGQFFKSPCVVLWGAFSFALLTAVLQGRIALGV